MSEQPGRGYLPPTVPAPGAHRRQWPTVVQQPYFGSAQSWQSTKPYILSGIGSGSPQSEGIDLTSRGSESQQNGEVINGQKEDSPITHENKEDRPVPGCLPGDSIPTSFSLEYKGNPAIPLKGGVEAGIPSPVESKEIPAESKGTPSHPVDAKVLQDNQEIKDEPSESPMEIDETPKKSSLVIDKIKTPAEADHVESLLENLFQGQDSPVKQSVIVSAPKTPALTEDKVVAILEDTPVADTLKKHPEIKTEPDIMEVESALEKMFAGIVESEDETKPEIDQQIETKKVKKPSKPRQRKSTETKEKKKKGKKFEIIKRLKTEKITKEGSNDSIFIQGKIKGPYVRIEGAKDVPSFVGVVNSWGREEEEKDRIDKTGRRKINSYVEGRVKGAGLYSSTLSLKYNSQTVDSTWVCIFCKKRPHVEGGLGGEPAGDLFGPYILTIPRPEDIELDKPSLKDVITEQKNLGGGKHLSLRAAGVAEQFVLSFSNKKSKKNSHLDDIVGEREVWVHEKCAVWAPGVLLVGSHLIGLGEAITSAKCNLCKETGACLGCVARNCYARCHYGCAIKLQWDLDYENFIATCPIHAQKKLKLLGRRT